MTALLAHDRVQADPVELPAFLLRDSGVDRRLMRPALALAIVVHALVLLLPMPSVGEEPVLAPAPPPDEPPVLFKYRPSAPIPRLREPIRVIPGPKEIVENDVRPDLLPDTLVSESVRELQAETGEIELLPGSIEAPPAEPQIYRGDEGRVGLALPVPHGDRARPRYPEVARVARREGRVVLAAVVTADGRVASVQVVVAPEPDLGFSQAAIDAVSQWRYEPGHYRGRPVAVELTVVIDFTLNP